MPSIDFSLYQLANSTEPPPQTLTVGSTTLLSLVKSVIDLLIEQQIAATLWLKLPPGEIWLAEIQRYHQQVGVSHIDNPKAVKLQVKQITLAQKQLRAIKKELNAATSNINQQAVQSSTDSIVSVGLDIFGKHKWAGRLRAETRQAIERDKKAARQPYLELKEAIDKLILEGDRLKLLAEEYLLGYQN